MRFFVSLAVVAVFSAGSAFAAEQTWTGRISDSNCGMVHNSDIEHGGKITARECVIGQEGNANIPGCVSAKNGRQFVFVSGDKIYKISNQDLAALRVHAEHSISLTGELTGDSIKVTKIAMAAK